MSEGLDKNSELNEETATTTQEQSTDEPTEGSAGTDNTSEVKEPTPEEQVAALNDKYLRLYSEFDNYRKRTNKEKLDLIATASAGVLKDMTSILDDFDRAIANNDQVADIEAVKAGFQLIQTKLKASLEAKGLKQMEAKGKPFDPELHEAIANIPAPSKDLKGKVVEDVEKGYYLNDKVIRYAKVVVGQ